MEQLRSRRNVLADVCRRLRWKHRRWAQGYPPYLVLQDHATRDRTLFPSNRRRPLRLGGKPVEDPELRRNILVYFGLILVIFVLSWMFMVTVEPDATWGATIEHKLIDSASGIAATLNNIGPGLGTVGATQNYGHFSPLSKFLSSG